MLDSNPRVTAVTLSGRGKKNRNPSLRGARRWDAHSRNLKNSRHRAFPHLVQLQKWSVSRVPRPVELALPSG